MKKNILLVCVLLFSSQSIFSQSAWQWVNPKTSFVTIRDASSTGVEGVVYFCGDGGVLLKSTNFGNTFSVENVPSHIRYTSVSFANQTTGYLMGYDTDLLNTHQLNNYLLKTTNSGDEWFLHKQFTSKSRYNVTAPSPQRIYLYPTGRNYSGNFYYSTNGGDSLKTLNNYGISTSLKFVNDQTGFVLTNNNRSIIKLTNGGLNQASIYIHPTPILFAIDFLNENTGFAAGANGKIIKTSNGGNNWIDVSITENKKFTTVKIFNQSIIYAATDDGLIYKTNNGGSSWIVQTSGSSNFSFQGFVRLEYAPNDRIFAFGELGNIFSNTLITSNIIWEKRAPSQSLLSNFKCRSIDFINNNTGYVLFENGLVMRTTNAGLNFEGIHYPAGNLTMYAMKFMNQNTGLIAGGSGYIRRTGNGGSTWSTISSSQSYWFLDMDIVGDDVYASASNGILRRSTNTGLAWHTVANPASEQIYTVNFIDQNTGFIGEYKIYKTTDKGITWTEPLISPLLTQQTAFHKINFLNSTTGYAAAEVVTGSGGRVYKTTDGGNIWYRVLNHNTAIYNVMFKDENTGYASGAASHVYKTTNSGVNWQIVYSNEFYPGDQNIWLHSLAVTQNDVVLTGGTFGALLGTNLGNTVGIQNISNSELPLSFLLHQNYPNPFNPVTKITFDVPSNLKNTYVTLSVYNILGQQVAELVNTQLSPGKYEYTFDARGLSSGVYYYRLKAGDLVHSKKMVLKK